MAKLLKIIGRTIGITLEWVLVVLILFVFAVRSSSFQTYLGQLATSYLSKEMNAEIRIGKIDFVFIDRFTLKDVFIADPNGDTLANVGKIELRIERLNLSANKLTIKEAVVHNGYIHLFREAKKGDYNYFFLLDYFGSSEKKTKSNSEPMAVTVKSVGLANIHFKYDDFRKGNSEYGMDFDHLDFKHVQLMASQLKTTKNGGVKLSLDHFTAFEKCGFYLKNLSTLAEINPDRGILLSKVNIQTPKTSIYASKLNLRAKSFEAFQHFNDQVRFDAVIDSSSINLKDITYFAPVLEGMDQQIKLTATVQKPLSWLSITDFDLRFGRRSVVRGDFSLPDFSAMSSSKFKQSLEYALIDLTDVKEFHLPKAAGEKQLSFDPKVERLKYAELTRLYVNGSTNSFFFSAKKISTDLGTIHLDNGLQFNALNEGGYSFKRTQNAAYDVKVDSFQLGKFLADDMLGKVKGDFFLSGVVGQKDVIRFNELSGTIQQAGFNHYNYSNISIQNGSFIDNKFIAKIDINDPHLKMSYNGALDLNQQQKFDIDLTVDQADLGKLGFNPDPEAKLIADVDVHLKMTNLDDLQGTVNASKVAFQQDGKNYNLNQLDLTITRGATDELKLYSDLIDINATGKVTSGNFVALLNNSISELLPAYVPKMKVQKNAKPEYLHVESTINETKDILAIYYPELEIAYGTKVNFDFNSAENKQTLALNSALVTIYGSAKKDTTDKRYFSNLVINETLQSGQMKLNLFANKASINDSLYVNDFKIDANGDKGVFATTTKWNEQLPLESARFVLLADLKDTAKTKLTLKPSEFHLKSKLWEIQNTAKIVIESKKIDINHLTIERDEQFIGLNGLISPDERDILKCNLNDVHLAEFSSFISSDLAVEGLLNGQLNVKELYTKPQGQGNISVNKLFINEQKIGDLRIAGVWNASIDAFIFSEGSELEYEPDKTLAIKGRIFPIREHNNYNLRLNFNNTDLKFVNAFMDPTVVSNISGSLKGELAVSGDLAAPRINGALDLNNGGAKIGILGTTYQFKGGKINFENAKGTITATVPTYDEDNNNALIKAVIKHDAFTNFDVKTDFYFNKYKVDNFSGKFMVLNTPYKEGELYYGKAYATGSASIGITGDAVKIAVNATTASGTKVILPMYGASDISDFPFITFGEQKAEDPRLNLTGVEMDLKIHATPDAEMKLDFNPKTGDAITVRGHTASDGLNISLDQKNMITMSGEYIFDEGKYHFVLPPYEEDFFLKQGGNIKWTGSPYDAMMDITAYVPVSVDYSDLTGDQNSSLGFGTVDLGLKIDQKLSKPNVVLKVDAVNPSSEEKNVLSRATATVEETQKQWFSVFAFKKFAPLNGDNHGGAGAVTDLLVDKINDQLKGKFGKNVDLGFQNKSGQTNTQTSVNTNIQVNEKITIKTAVGVQSAQQGETSTSSFVGDVSIEYKINDDGTFRLLIFNEQANRSDVTSTGNNDYVQGLSLSYNSEFNNPGDRKRRKTNKKKKNNKLIPIDSSAVKEEENTINLQTSKPTKKN